MKKGDTILIPIHHPLFVLFVLSGYFELEALFTHMMKAKANVTRLHSSRMRAARLLPVSPSIHCAGGWGAPGPGECLLCWGGVCLPLVWGVCLPLVPGGCVSQHAMGQTPL